MLLVISPIVPTKSPQLQASTSTKDDSLKIEYAPTKIAPAIRIPAIESACNIPKYVLETTPINTATDESASNTPLNPPTNRAVEPIFFEVRLIQTDANKIITAETAANKIAISALATVLFITHES